MNNQKLAFFLPNTFTALNMGCGYASIIFGLQGQMYKACMVLLLGAIFDSVDGRVARITGTESSFGEQFDSMSDVVSFGVAPALLVYNRFFVELGRAGLIASFIFTLCGALRLARFNANIEKVSSNFFQGLPIPGGAMAVVGLVLWSIEFPQFFEVKWWPAIYMVFVSFLMISNIPFNSFKNSAWVKTHRKRVLFLIFVTLALTFLYEEIMIGMIINIYVFISIIYFFLNKGKFDEVFLWKNENEEA